MGQVIRFRPARHRGAPVPALPASVARQQLPAFGPIEILNQRIGSQDWLSDLAPALQTALNACRSDELSLRESVSGLLEQTGDHDLVWDTLTRLAGAARELAQVQSVLREAHRRLSLIMDRIEREEPHIA